MRLSSKSGWAAANARSVSSPASKIAASTRSVQVTTVFLMSPAMMVGTFMSVPPRRTGSSVPRRWPDVGQPHGPRKDIVEIGRFRIRNVDGVPLGEDAPGGEVQHLFPRRIQIAYARRLHQYGLLVIHGPPPRRPKRRQVKCAGTRTLRQYFCASCGEVSFVRYRRIVIRIEWARCTAAPCSASYGWHQKNGRRHRGTCRCRLRGKGDGRGGYRSHVPSSSSLASRVSGKTSRRPMCFTSNFLFRAAKWRSP